MYTKSAALDQYKKVNTQSIIENASMHQLVQMLMAGALERMAQARGALQRKDISGKGMMLGKSIAIIAGLQTSLDMEQGGDVAANLERLYDYMQHRLLEANINNDETMIDEVMSLMRTVKSGWDMISPDLPVREVQE